MSEKVGKIEIVIKGGKPWGFNLQTKDENRSIVIVNEIIQGGKADQQGELKKGDHVIKINGIQCLSLADAVQLIESAFRTLTIVVWRTSNFLNKNKYKDYVNIVPQFDEVPYNSDSSYDNPSYSSVYENVQATFQNQKTRNRKFSPLQNTNNSSDKSIFTNSRKAYINSAKVQPEKIDLKNNIRTSNLCINKTFSNESERKASISHNLETKFYSKIPNEVQHCNNVQQIPALDHISDLTCNKSVNLCEVSSQHHVPSLPIQKNVFVANSDFSRHSSKNLLTASKFLMESNCCMYPNCHNKFVNCKIHSPPERDTANPVRQQSRNNTSDYENIEFFSHSNFIQNHDSLNSQQNGNAPELNSLSSCMTDNKILEAEKSVPFKFCDSPLSQSSPHSMIISEEPLSYHIPDSITSSYNNSVEKNRPLYQSQILNFDDSQKTNVLDVSPSLSSETVSSSNIFHNTAVNGLLNHASYESQENYVTGDTFYSFCSTSSTLNEDALTYVNNATFVKEKDLFVDASNNALCMISKEATVVKLISARQEQTYTDEDEELKEIEKNRNSNTMFFEPVNESPPLPSPPLETEAEILPSNEPLPSPPSFVSEPDIYQKEENGNEFVEAIYANLEMLKIQCSVVNSSSQTNSMPKKNSVEYCKKSCDNAADFSFMKKTSHQVQPVDSKPQDISFIERILQSQEEKFFRKVFNLPFNSAYFTTSVPKAKLLTRYTSKLHSKNPTGIKELSCEKEELMSSIKKKLDILLEEKAALQEELKQNDELGNKLSVKLRKTAQQNEWKKFSNHVEELEKISNLLLSLSGRLARTKNALLFLSSDASSEEKGLLESKYKRLSQQYEEALHLQKNINNRNHQVLFYLQKYLSKDELADYNHFIKMKVKLLVDYKELIEKIKLGDEQLKALTSS